MPHDYEIRSDLDGNRYVLVPEYEFEEMQSELMWLSALEDAGVDNWVGFDYARETYHEWLTDGAEAK